jgi:hypothetical protein
VEILRVHGAFYYDYQPAAFQMASQFNQKPTSSFDYETYRRTKEQNTDFGVGEGKGVSFLKISNVKRKANN